MRRSTLHYARTPVSTWRLHGVFLVARRRDAVLGCAGLRLLSERIGEVKRLFVAPAARGCGLGALLMGELERIARGHGLSLLRLDTRHDLVESRRLYAALGYEEVPAFNDGQYAEHWLANPLGGVRLATVVVG
jgi:GNAT superfamily N-acetyltransferase